MPTTPNIGIVVLTGSRTERMRYERRLRFEANTRLYTVSRVRRSESPKAFVLLFKCKLEIALSDIIQELAEMCGTQPLGGIARYTTPYNTKIPMSVFLSMVTSVWTPLNQAEHQIALKILELSHEVSRVTS